MKPIDTLTEHRYGFKWGPVDVIRCASEEKWGVLLTLETASKTLEIRVTPGGNFRIGKPTLKPKGDPR